MGTTISLIRRHKPFRALLAALAVSQLGDWLYNLALVALVYDRTHSVAWTSATTIARVVPMVVLGPFGGVLADRYDRRVLMIVADAVRTGLMVLLAAVAWAGLPIVLAPVIAGLSTIAGAVYPSAVAATMPRLVSDADLPAANGARSATQSIAVIAGPAGGAVLLLLGSAGAAFLINAATFALSALLVLAVRGREGLFAAPERTDEDAAGILHELREGVVALRRNGLAARLIGADIMCSFLYGAQTVLLLMLGRRLGYGDSGYGWLLAGFGIGGLVGAAIAGRFADSRAPRRAIAGILLVASGASALFAVVPWMLGAVALGIVVAVGSMVVEIVADTALAREMDDAVLARAYGVAFPASIGGIAIGSLVAAPLVGLLGLSGALVAVGAIAAVYAGYLYLPARATAPAVTSPDEAAGPASAADAMSTSGVMTTGGAMTVPAA